MKWRLYSGAGNRFVLMDAIRGAQPTDPARVARELDVDGALVLSAPRADGDARMIVFNRDGSRPAACGNGLRCLARHARQAGHVDRDEFVVETDAGPRRVRVEGAAITTEIGLARIEAIVRIEVANDVFEATLVEVGNPHCVLFRDALSGDEVVSVGSALEHHARFPHGTNVEFVTVTAAGLVARVWERGVGETAACGTGAAAAAAAARVREALELPIDVFLPGGLLTVSGAADGSLWVRGPVEDLGEAGSPQ